MAQGIVKSKAIGPKATQRKQTGNRVIKPKKTVLVRNNVIKKKHSAGLTSMTEKALAGKAGHLELLHGGKKDKKVADAKKAAAAAAKKAGK